jgi:heme A synthase
MSPADSPLLATLIELRILHPLIAFAVGGLIWLAIYLAQQGNVVPVLRRTGYALLGVYALQLFLGALNVFLQAPVWMQLVHLLVSDIIWILLTILAAQRLAVSATDTEPAPLGKAMIQTGD